MTARATSGNRAPAVLVLALALLMLPAAPALPGAPGAAADAHVHLENIAFDPEQVVILVGESIEWDNHDLVPHTVTADDGSFDSGNMNNGAVYTRTFTTPATIPYHCDLHPQMTGTIVVSDPNAMPDLVVVDIEPKDSVPGLVKNVNVTVRNLGNAAAGASTARLTYAYQGGEPLVADLGFPVLGPGAAFTNATQWSTLLKLGDFELRALADAAGAVVEGDEGNNLATEVTSVLVPGVPGIDLLDPV